MRWCTVAFIFVPGYDLPWEEKGFPYPSNFATPLEIAIEASNGASDYGNKFGEPIVTGFARSFGMKLLHGERREYIKPVMFSGGIGLMDDAAKRKQEAEIGMKSNQCILYWPLKLIDYINKFTI